MKLIVDTTARVAYLDGEHIHLSQMEFSMLVLLAQDPETPIPHQTIREALVIRDLRAVRYYARRLRARFRVHGVDIVSNVYGRGYRLARPGQWFDVLLGAGVATRETVLA